MTMKSVWLGTAFAVACGGAFGGAAEAAQLNGWYLGLEGGANWVEDWNSAFITVPVVSTFDTGWLVLGTAGYKWANNFRVEFEAGYRHNSFDTIEVVDGPPPFSVSNVDLWEATAMANVLYDLALTNDLSLSVGAGAGADFASIDAGGLADLDEWNFAYQGIAGVNYSVGRQTALFLNYRYLRVTSPEFEIASIPILTNSDDFVKHAVTIGLRYALQSSQSYVGSAPPPPSSSSAPPRQFIVFFGFNKYNLTSEANRVISEAVTAAKETGSASILITGHTDTVGSNIYNDRLSMRRSNVVKAEMVRQGVSPSSISASGKGETELLVQTADGVKEPQNRRASIDLN
jgi:OmpA-OmpF porin, OOP family